MLFQLSDTFQCHVLLPIYMTGKQLQLPGLTTNPSHLISTLGVLWFNTAGSKAHTVRRGRELKKKTQQTKVELVG